MWDAGFTKVIDASDYCLGRRQMYFMEQSPGDSDMIRGSFFVDWWYVIGAPGGCAGTMGVVCWMSFSVTGVWVCLMWGGGLRSDGVIAGEWLFLCVEGLWRGGGRGFF